LRTLRRGVKGKWDRDLLCRTAGENKGDRTADGAAPQRHTYAKILQKAEGKRADKAIASFHQGRESWGGEKEKKVHDPLSLYVAFRRDHERGKKEDRFKKKEQE